MGRAGTIAIVGSGQGGFQLAASLREAGVEGRVILLGEEGTLPYQRPPLSKAYLLGKIDADMVRLRPERFFAEHRVELRTGTRVIGIDRNARRVVLSACEPIAYDHLVLATGARNRELPVPGARLGGVFQLRTVAEAEALRQALRDARAVVVVGAGFIGLEVAATARALGLDVTVIEAAARPMARALSAPMAEHVRAAHEAAGVRFRFGTTLAQILGADGRARGIETTDGEIVAADCILVGVGVVPNAELAIDAGLAADDGIVVDAYLRTADRAISAIGDCARYPSRFADGPVRLESVQNAVDQARCVAAGLAGRPAPYASLPWFWSEQGALKLQIAGLTQPHDEAVLRSDPAVGGLSVFCYRAGRLVGVESANRPLDHMNARKLLGLGLSPSPAQAADPAFDLKRLAAEA